MFYPSHFVDDFGYHNVAFMVVSDDSSHFKTDFDTVDVDSAKPKMTKVVYSPRGMTPNWYIYLPYNDFFTLEIYDSHGHLVQNELKTYLLTGNYKIQGVYAFVNRGEYSCVAKFCGSVFIEKFPIPN